MSTSVEVVVIDWDGPASALSARLARLLAQGVDVVLCPSAGTAAAAAAVGQPPDGTGRMVLWTGRGDPVDWARHRLAGTGAPEGAVVAVDDVEALDALVPSDGGFPAPVVDPAWRLEVDGTNPDREREVESWLTVGNGRTGTRGSLEEGGATSLPALYVAGIYGWDPHEQAGPELVRGPEWTSVTPGEGGLPPDHRRVLDLRNGVLFRESTGFRSARFASLADRHVLVLETEGATVGPVPVPEVGGAVAAADADEAGIRLQGVNGGEVWFAESSSDTSRLVVVDRDGPADTALARASSAGPDRLLARHRRAWRERWLDADVVVHGDGEAQRHLRFALYHLVIAGDPESDLASVGARALTGPGYRGHVFWDTEVFVLPFYVWTHPRTARALLAYRHRTLPAARAKAARLGYEGALYAWESADTGDETTPEFIDLPDGTRLTVLTGLQEHHIAADVAWGVWHYWQVTGDDAFVEEMGAEIVVETARFWASRTTPDDDGRLHIREVIGPDEYHEGVDDNAYTNVLARWNLRAAGAVCDRFPGVAARLGVTAEDRRRWEEVAAGLVVLFDPKTQLYEQFEGFFDLENVRAVDLAPRPFTGEVVVGVDRLRTTQVVKQADVLMVGRLLPDEVSAEVQAANYRYYEPRTSHGSSLSPAIHAWAAARVGDAAGALSYFHLAGGVDLDNRMGNAADGVHIATMGGLWQAAVFGFGGVRAEGDALRIDPRLPPSWDGLAFPVRWRDTRVAVDVRAGVLDVDLDGPALVAVGDGEPVQLGAGRFTFGREAGGGRGPARRDGMAPVDSSFDGLDAIIFDMDGVVTDTAVVHAAAWKKLFDAYLKQVAMATGADLLPFDKRQDYERYVDGKNRYDGVRSFLESRGIHLPEGSPGDPAGSDTVCAMGNDKDNYFLEHVREHGVRAYESTVRLIGDLRAKGVKVGLVSASRNAEEVLSIAGVVDLFHERVDGVVAAELDLPGKPDPATFLEAARRLGVDPSRAAVVEDALSGVAAGRAGGFGLVVGVARAGQHDALRQAGADVVVADMAEFETAAH